MSLAGGWLSAAGCATLRPFPQTDETPTRARQSETTSGRGPAITVVEGQPSGLVLRLSARRRHPAGTKLAVYRQRQRRQREALQTTTLSERDSNRLKRDGLQWVDRSIAEPARYRYRLSLAPPDHEQTIWSQKLEVQWAEPPPTPDRTACRAVDGRLVEINWAPAARGILLFRKQVTAESAEFRRLAMWQASARGVAIDRDVQQGQVYAYRLALVERSSGFPQFGEPSPPVYVSL